MTCSETGNNVVFIKGIMVLHVFRLYQTNYEDWAPSALMNAVISV